MYKKFSTTLGKILHMYFYMHASAVDGNSMLQYTLRLSVTLMTWTLVWLPQGGTRILRMFRNSEFV